jgi:enoyl-CoA hydratase/carnithine racemase
VDQARATGIINKSWSAESHESFMRQVMDYAHTFTPPSKAAMAVGHMKRAVQSGSEMSLEQGLALERELQAALFASSDAKEGMTAFTQKRKPSFRGK